MWVAASSVGNNASLLSYLEQCGTAMAELFEAAPARLLLQPLPRSSNRFWTCLLMYWLPWSEWYSSARGLPRRPMVRLHIDVLVQLRNLGVVVDPESAHTVANSNASSQACALERWMWRGQ